MTEPIDRLPMAVSFLQNDDDQAGARGGLAGRA